jgi:UrcA family protein
MRTLSIVLALAAASVAVPAAAAEPAQIGVRYADLDLSTGDGRATLDRRIEEAARAMCGRDVTTGTILLNGKSSRCVERAKASVHKTIAERVARDRNRG